MTVDAARWAEEFLSAPLSRRRGAVVEEAPEAAEAEEPAVKQTATEASVEEASVEETPTDDAGEVADEAVETPVDEEGRGRCG